MAAHGKHKMSIKRSIVKPKEYGAFKHGSPAIQYGIRSVGSDFDRRPEVGSAPVYIGPSKVEGRSTSVGGGSSQSKKHSSTGTGQG